MKYALVLIALLTAGITYAQTDDSVSARIILIGDGGALVNGKYPVGNAVKNFLQPDKKTTIVYLGDNLYRWGLPDESNIHFVLSRSVLDSQMAVAANTPAHVYMIPGNHDWANGRQDGWQTLLRQEAYVNLMKEKNVQFVPSGGCPGPVEVKISKDVVMIVFDSQWFLHPYEKPGIEWDCDCKTESEFMLQLSELIRKNYDKLVILACHHPFMSNGIHGGYFGLKQHIFPLTDAKKNLYIPLPVIGSIYPISRSIFGSPQDISYPAYQNMVTRIEAETKMHKNVIFATGHDHSLQLLKDTSNYYIVSGSGCHTSRVEDSKSSLFTKEAIGFSVLELSKNKNVRVKFYEVDINTNKPSEIYSNNILDLTKLPALAPDTATLHIPPYTDYYTTAASNQYKNASQIKKFILGKNYRDVWSEPVKLKVFRLKEEHGGFKIKNMGGGKQTKSLTLEDKNGKEWSLRTIDKDPELALPENLRNTVASQIVQDMISAAHPYAPGPVAALSTATNIPHATPRFFLVPNDIAFGEYRTVFANKVCMLEEKDASWDGKDTKSSITVFNNMLEDNEKKVLQKEVLNARLLDILIADWDRHMDQFKWGVRDTGRGKLYYPIPKDRDQAFFHSEGLLIAYVSRKRIPFLKGLRHHIPDVTHLGAVSKDFDRVFMNGINKQQWDSVTKRFIQRLPDATIEESVKQMPPEIYALDGKEITGKLISRRNYLQKKSLKYYNFLSKEVSVLGSNETEVFTVKDEGEQVRVQVLSRKKDNDTSFIMYDRLFDPNETKELRLYGFRGNDKFNIDANASKKMFIRIVGGRGNDTFNIKGNIRNYVYDLNTEKNFVQKGNRTKYRLSSNPQVNDYDFNEYKYDIFHFPRINAGWNADDGFMIGAGLWFRHQGWRKSPFQSEQRLNTLFAVGQKAYQMRYRGLFVDVLPKTDIVINAELMDPVLTNFFGFGNTTKINGDSNIKFYRARYKDVAADVLLKKKLFPVLNVFIGPSFFHYWNKLERNQDYILGKPSFVGLDSNEVYTRKTYGGFKTGIQLNNLNNELFPTRGINWTTTFTHLQPLTKNAESISKIESDMAVYASLSFPAKWVTVLRLGAGRILSNNKLEYFQAMTLGANNFLRGFRKNRFAGDALAYGSLEFRVKLFDSKSYVFPGQVGLVAFNDVGRVWLKGENSNKWHNAYGGGFYYVPYNMVLISTTVAFSREESLVNFTLGTKLNLTF